MELNSLYWPHFLAALPVFFPPFLLRKSQFFGFSLDSLSLYTPNLDFSLKFAENKTECLATPPTNSLS
jgi:hypothetical protein